MKIVCPDKNNPEWKSLVELVGLDKAYKAFVKNDYNIPKIEREVTDKLGLAVVDALKITSKKLKILNAKKEKSERAGKEADYLSKMQESLVDALVKETHKEGLLNFAQQIGNDIDLIKEDLENKKFDSRIKSSKIRSSLSYIDALIPMIDDITKYLVNKPDKDAQELEIFGILSSKRAVLQKLREDTVESGRDIFMELLQPLLGDRNNPKLLAEINKNLPADKKIKEFDLLTALKKGERGNNLMDRWLRSMANNPDEMLKLINEVVMRRKAEARLNAVADKYKLMQIRNDYLKAGGKDFDWVYETRRDGTLTGNFISERRWTEFYEDLGKFKMKYLKDRGFSQVHELTPYERSKYEDAKKQWWDSNSELLTIENGNKSTTLRAPSLSKYGNSTFNKLGAPEKKAIEEIKKLKSTLDEQIHPKFRHIHRVPQVSKDFYERVKTAKNMGDIREIFVGEVQQRDYDVDQGNKYNVDDASVAHVLSDQGREVELLPMHFTRKLDNMDRNLSKDIISSMVVYSHMARDYNVMDEIIDTLEVGREILRERQLVDSDTRGRIKKTVSYVAGTKIEETLFKDNDLAFKRFEDFMTMVVYGKTRVERGNITIFGKELNMDKEKVIDLLGQYTAINALAINVYAGIANIGQGEAQLHIEAASGRYINMKNVLKADQKYVEGLPSFLAQHGNVHNTSKLSLWYDLMDPLQNYQSDKYQTDAMRKTWFARSMKSSSLFFINRMGEHYMQGRTSIALAESVKLKDNTGQELSLYDAYEVTKSGLQLKKGVTKLDGTAWTKDDLITFMRRQDFLNQRMHGIYNENDAAALQKYALGRLALMFRKFMVPGWDRRWEATNYNYMLGDFTEGYYYTTKNFLGNVIKDLYHMKFSLIKNWDNLTSVQKSNIFRTMTEMSFVLALSTLLTFFLGGDSPEEDTWIRNMTEYQARRIITELLFFLNPNETFTILKSPMAAITPVQNLIKFTGSIMNPFAWNDKYESGRYEDWYKWQKQGLTLLPFYKTIDRLQHPEEALKFWNMN